ITGIQRDIEQIMGALPAGEALDFAILTHILGGQRHALDLLEILEAKLKGSRGDYKRDSSRAHRALLAVSREIEADARRTSGDAAAAVPPTGRSGGSRAGASPDRDPRRAPPAPQAAPQGRRQAAKQPGARTSAGKSPRARLVKPMIVGTATLVLGAGLVVGGAYLERLRRIAPPPPIETVETGTATAASEQNASAQPTTLAAANVAALTPSMEQPYLVVLSTRRSTEELQQDYRSYKASYPELLKTAKARVDRVQGQDKQTYYRLSLIPPQARDDAKELCSSLRKAGLTGCWIKPVPLH
ncbi:MAG: SPOR domain-containing protein, partial [Hyphomicrobium sp.]